MTASPDPQSVADAHGRVLGIDPGERWVGVAVSDDDRRLALPLATLDRREESDDGITRIRTLLGPDGASLVIVGVPLTSAGDHDAQATAFQTYGARVAAGLNLPVAMISERHSNSPTLPVGKRSSRRQAGARSPAKQREARRLEHAVAAATILQRWLDQRASQGAAPA